MNTAPAPTLAGYFALIIDGLCRTIAARGAKSQAAGPLIILLWKRLRRTAVRFTALAARVQAGTLPSSVRPRRRGKRAHPRSPAGEGRSEGPSGLAQPRLPTSFGWLLRLGPEIACYRSQLCHFLSDPDVTALLSASPQFGRMLRPLCHMLGLQLPNSEPEHRGSSTVMARVGGSSTNLSSSAAPPPDAPISPPRPSPDPWPTAFFLSHTRPKLA